jgi:hypothetical protein
MAASKAAGKASKGGGAKSGGAKSGGAKAGGAKGGASKASGAKSGGAKSGGAKSGGAKSLANHGRPWSSADMKLLRELARKATPTRQASEQLGRSLDSVKSKASEEGISFKPRGGRGGAGRAR